MVNDSSEQLTTIFLALADPTRRAILSRLTHGEASGTELARPFSISVPAISKHLRVLRTARLLILVAPPDGDGRKQHHQVPAPFRTRDATGKTALDFGAVVLRFS